MSYATRQFAQYGHLVWNDAMDASKPDSVRIAAITDLQRRLNELLAERVQNFRECGATWEEIGSAAMMSKQGAQKRWG